MAIFNSYVKLPEANNDDPGIFPPSKCRVIEDMIGR